MPLSGSDIDRGGRLNAGHRAQARQQLIEERDLLRLSSYRESGSVSSNVSACAGVEAGIDRLPAS